MQARGLWESRVHMPIERVEVSGGIRITWNQGLKCLGLSFLFLNRVSLSNGFLLQAEEELQMAFGISVLLPARDCLSSFSS
jgi:hypothetical protein